MTAVLLEILLVLPGAWPGGEEADEVIGPFCLFVVRREDPEWSAAEGDFSSAPAFLFRLGVPEFRDLREVSSVDGGRLRFCETPVESDS